MQEPIERRVEKLEVELAALRQDYMFLCAFIGVSIGFIKNLHSVVELSDSTTTRLLNGWTAEVDKRDSVTDLFRDLKDKFGGSDGPAARP